jgi:hypothetical protein
VCASSVNFVGLDGNDLRVDWPRNILSVMSKRPIDGVCDELMPDIVPLSLYIDVDRSGTIFAII